MCVPDLGMLRTNTDLVLKQGAVSDVLRNFALVDKARWEREKNACIAKYLGNAVRADYPGDCIGRFGHKRGVNGSAQIRELCRRLGDEINQAAW